jgi:hypothetical protein
MNANVDAWNGKEVLKVQLMGPKKVAERSAILKEAVHVAAPAHTC